MKETNPELDTNEIVISYVPDKEGTILENKLKRKLLIALVSSIVYLIVFGFIFEGLIELAFGVLILLFLLIFPLSFIFEQKSRKVIRIPLSFITQVLVPTVIVFPFENLYGLMTISVLFTSLIFFILDFIFVKSMKSS